ncbi:hypothetical protein [Rhizobium indigoferae]|uniref:Uncharacterized protein n=1 Tax=Rhizobium indigoferae TaxID=158891 RepID=A0ABZ0Z6C0_9HYPH|nr:hypothetical protein [Rhizobium indigoferae]NNU57416.1 hypothetical protein [Rhizobium indigoferae]WQN35120.1 hypothetical protein U5G49_000141 [Rhizobium indigoferae]
MKKDIPASRRAGYRCRHKNPGGGKPRKSRGISWKHAREQKQIAPALEKGMRFRARRCIRRHNRAATANTGGGLHRFFGHERYFHDARNSGMMAAWSPSPADFLCAGLPPEAWATFNGFEKGDFPC